MTDEPETFDEWIARLKEESERPTLINRWLWREEKYEKAFITDDTKRIKGLYRRRILSFPFSLLVLLTIPYVIDRSWWLYTLECVLLSLFIGMASAQLWYRAVAYRSGWLDGRRDMYAAWWEAQQRGMDYSEFTRAMMEKDLHIRF